MSVEYTSVCSTATCLVQADGRVLVNGGYVAKSPPTWKFPAWTGEAATPTGVEQWADLVWAQSKKRGIPAALIAGIIAQESHGQLNAMNWGDNPHGAGLMQVTSAAAKQGYTDYDIVHNADLAIELGCDYFDQHCWQPNGGNYVRALATYNHGSVACGTYKGHANVWNLVCYHDGYLDYVSYVLDYQNHFIDSGTFDPNKNAPVPPPPAGTVNTVEVRDTTFAAVVTGGLMAGAAWLIAHLLRK